MKLITHDPKFKWFPQYEVCPLAEAIPEKIHYQKVSTRE
jgi:hypothetical protein